MNSIYKNPTTKSYRSSFAIVLMKPALMYEILLLFPISFFLFHCELLNYQVSRRVLFRAKAQRGSGMFSREVYRSGVYSVVGN